MMQRFRLMANKGIMQLFAALLLVVIIMVVSNYIVYKNSISSIYDQVSENNKLVVTNMIRSFDNSIKDMNGIINAIQQSPYNGWYNSQDIHDAYLTQQEVQKLVASKDYIEEIAVLHKNSDLAVLGTGTISVEEFFKQKYNNPIYHAEFWKSLMNSKHSLRVYPQQWYSDHGHSGITMRKLMVVAGSNLYLDKNVLVFLDMDKLLRHMNSVAMMKGSSLVVLDQDRNVILNTEEDWDLAEVLNDLNSGMNATGVMKKKNYEYNFFKSEYNDFIYINKVPYEFADMKSVTNANRLIIIIAIICAVLLSAVLSSYLYKPMRVILKLVGGRRDGEDLQNILTGIEQIQVENEAYKRRIDSIEEELRRNAFLEALDDVPRSQDAELRLQQTIIDLLKDKYFILAAFHLRPPVEIEQDMSYRVEDITYTIQSGLRERLGDLTVFHTSGMRFVALIGIHQPSDKEHALGQLRSFVQQVHEEEWKGSSLLVTVSRLYAYKTVNLSKANQDLVNGLVYRTIDTEGPIIDVQSIQFTWKVYIPVEEIEKASNALVGGNVGECIQIIDRILNKNKEQGIHHHQLIPVVKTLFFYMLRHLEASKSQPKDILAMEKAFAHNLELAVSYDRIQETLVNAIKVIGSNYEGEQGEQRGKLNPTAVVQYIESNYMENLHLEHMADILETTPKYFSNYFKKQFGVNFVEYLNKIRLSHAKQFLKTTDMSVADIGEKTGYLNASTFTSTFKKYYGISPSEYRKQHEK